MAAKWPVTRPATYMAIIVRMMTQAPSPAPIPVIGCGALGFAALVKIARPSMPKTVQIVMNVKTPAQIADQLARPGVIATFSFWSLISSISASFPNHTNCGRTRTYRERRISGDAAPYSALQNVSRYCPKANSYGLSTSPQALRSRFFYGSRNTDPRPLDHVRHRLNRPSQCHRREQRGHHHNQNHR